MTELSPIEAARAQKPGVVTFHLPAETLRSLGAKVPEGVNVLITEPAALAPAFIRLPKAGRGIVCSVSSLPRSSLIDLIQNSAGKIKTHKLKKRGQLGGGVVMINRQSLIDYISEQPPADWNEPETDEWKEDAE